MEAYNPKASENTDRGKIFPEMPFFLLANYIFTLFFFFCHLCANLRSGIKHSMRGCGREEENGKRCTDETLLSECQVGVLLAPSSPAQLQHRQLEQHSSAAPSRHTAVLPCPVRSPPSSSSDFYRGDPGCLFCPLRTRSCQLPADPNTAGSSDLKLRLSPGKKGH